MSSLNIDNTFFHKYARLFSPLATDTSCSFQDQRKPNFAGISLLIGPETHYVTSALFCMEKSVAEVFQVIELERILAVCLLLYFSKYISYLALEKEPLLHAYKTCTSCFEDTVFLRESPSLVSQRLGWYEDTCLG